MEQERIEIRHAAHVKKDKERKRKNASFLKRANRVNWDISKTYQQTTFIIFVVIGAAASLLADSLVFIIGGVAIGLYYPYMQLQKREDAYQSELPFRAEQAINAVEQQINDDIPTFDALKKAVPYMQSPIREEYQKAVEMIETMNISISKAVEDIPSRLNLPQLEYFHLILGVAEETEDKAADIIADASEMIRRRQKHRQRFMQEVASSLSEMKMMFYLIVMMVGTFFFMLDPEQIPLAGSPVHRALDILVIGGSGFFVWKYSKKMKEESQF